MPLKLFKTFRLWLRKRRYRVGVTLTHFIASDIRRDVEIMDVSELEAGFITAKIRTWNVLYTVKGLAQKPEFDPPKRVMLESLWDWTGQSWGGLPDGTSIVDRLQEDQSDPSKKEDA